MKPRMSCVICSRPWPAEALRHLVTFCRDSGCMEENNQCPRLFLRQPNATIAILKSPTVRLSATAPLSHSVGLWPLGRHDGIGEEVCHEASHWFLSCWLAALAN